MDSQGKTDRPHAELGHLLQDLRRKRAREMGERLTQARLAEALGVHEGTVTAWENGYQRPEGENAVRLAELLGVPVRVLYGGADELEPEHPDAERIQELEDALAEIGRIVARTGRSISGKAPVRPVPREERKRG
jgi:transcriptional regulator with XRE-family HTH domain